MELWLPFVLASIIILIIPGPTIILVISQAVSYGRRSVVPLTAGVLLGDFTAMSLSLLGLGAVLSASSALFNTFKWVGVIYLFYLGIKLWRLNPNTVPPHHNTQKTSTGSLLRRSFIVTALNPKSIAFFVAFLPQFVNPLQPALPQLLLLGGTFLLLATINATLYALFAGQLSEQIKKPNVRKWIDRCGGSALIGAGIFTAGMRQSG